MSIAVISMVRNEADRYLRSALSCWQEFADEIIVLDDCSDDGTLELLREAKVTTIDSTRTVQLAKAWGAEWLPRKTLWDMALRSKCDWLFWLDADMIPAGDPKELQARGVDAFAFRLYDLWDWRSLAYRADNQWQAHANARIWMIRNPHTHVNDANLWLWHERGIHCGHMPWNYNPARVLVAPIDHSILHYGYAEETDRAGKAAAYATQESQLAPQEIMHARSIADETYITFPLPFLPTWRLNHERASAFSLDAACGKTQQSSLHIGAPYAG